MLRGVPSTLLLLAGQERLCRLATVEITIHGSGRSRQLLEFNDIRKRRIFRHGHGLTAAER